MTYMHCSLADIDECAVNNGSCVDVCTNTNGSYFCSCNAGSLLGANAKTCTGKWTQITQSHLPLQFDLKNKNECASK